MQTTTSTVTPASSKTLIRAAQRNVLVTIVGRGAALALNLLNTIWIIQYLGPERYGGFVVVLSIVTLLDLAMESSLFEIAAREIAKTPSRAAHWLGAATLVRGICSVVIATVMSGVALIVPLPGEAAGLLYAGSLIFVLNALRAPITYFRARLVIHWELGPWVLARAVELALVVYLIRGEGTPGQLMATRAIGAALFALTTWSLLLVACRQRVVFRRARLLIRPLLRYAAPIAVTTTLILTQLKGDILLISMLLSAAAAGAFGAVVQVAEVVLIGGSMLMATVGPVLARTVGQRELPRFNAIVQRVFEALLVVLPGLALVGAVLAEPIVLLAFGAEYRTIVPEFRIMMGVAVLIPVAGLMGAAAVALNLQQQLIRVELTNVTLYVFANLLLLPWVGTIGSACIRLVVLLVGPAWTRRIVGRQSGLRLRWNWLGCVVPALVVAGALMLLLMGLPAVIVGGVGLVTYAAVLLAARRVFPASSAA